MTGLGSGVSEGLFGLTLILAPPGVTATCDITLPACFTRLQTLRGAQRYLSAGRVSDKGNGGEAEPRENMLHCSMMRRLKSGTLIDIPFVLMPHCSISLIDVRGPYKHNSAPLCPQT